MVFDKDVLKNNALLSYYQEYQNTDKAGFAVFNRGGNILSFNDELPTILQLDRDSLLGKNIFALLDIEHDVLDMVFQQKAVSRSITIKKNHYLHAHFGPVYCSDKTDRGFMIISDKSQEESYLKDLDRNLNQLKALIDDFNIGFVILDDDHKIIEANQTFCDNLGYTIDEVLNLTGWDFIADFNEDKKIHDFVLNDTFEFDKDNYHIKKNGKLIPMKATCTIGIINGKKIALCFYQNISEQLESSIRLEQSEMMLRNFISNSTEIIMVLNKKMEITYLSPNTKKVFGYQKNIPRIEIVERFLPFRDKDFKEYIKKKLKDKEDNIEFEYEINSRNKHKRFFSVRTSTIKVDEKMVICYIREITKDKEYIEELKILSYTDQLTSLYNRKFMEEQLLELRKKENLPISIISADLDGLKEVNDSLGHQAGDEFLKMFSNILRNSHKKPEEIFRIGGDEFLIIATKATEKIAKNIIQSIEKSIDKHNSSPSSILKISASIGFATSDDLTSNLSAMLAQADREMYKVKNAKKALKNYIQ